MLEVVVAERDGRIVGCADRRREEVRDRCWLDVRVHDGEAELAAQMLRDIEQRAAPDVDPGARAMTYVASVDDTLRGVVEAAGYRLIRASYHMGDRARRPPGARLARRARGDDLRPRAGRSGRARDRAGVVSRPLGAHRPLARGVAHVHDRDARASTPRSGSLPARTVRSQASRSAASTGPETPEHGYVSSLGVRRPWRKRGLGLALLQHSFGEMKRRGMTRASLDVDAENLTGAVAPLRAGRHERRAALRLLPEETVVSRLRARCPDCRTLTAVALGPEYQCHSCGREFGAGLVRVPRAWGTGGEAMAEAAWTALPYPETAVIEADTLAEQTLLLAAELPDRPVVLGGCCCSHVGAIEALSAGEECLAVVWIDAHGDLNTPQTSPSGQRVGDAAPDGDRPRRGPAEARGARRRPQSRSARGRVHRRERHPDRRVRDRRCARRRRRGLRRARLRCGRAR